MTTSELDPVVTAEEATTHLTPERWAAANRHVVRKALAEFSHERILIPEFLGPDPQAAGLGRYRLSSDDGSVEYRFSARKLELEHWSIVDTSIHRLVAGAYHDVPAPGAGEWASPSGERTDLDALRFITEFRGTLGIRVEMLPVYLEEISSTLSSHAYKQWRGQPTSAELAAGVTGGVDAALDFQTIERSMTEGHPCFVANNGRLGFGIADYRAFAPEAGAPVRLEWIAVHRSRAVFTSVEGLHYRNHLNAELGRSAVASFNVELAARGLDPDEYFLMPVHPWQWDNKLTITFAAEIAQQRILHLGTGADGYQAQQSIRTFFNLASPEKCYVKTAMSVLNMGFMRGLSPQYMKATPAINDWLGKLIDGDAALQQRGLGLIREVAAIGYHNGHYEAAAAKDSPYRKMLSALWRESPVVLLKDGQQLATMASLLHVDAAGKPMVSALIERSRLEPTQWLRRYLDAYLVPLVHCFYAYELAFMPHGENVILVLENGVPVSSVMKDIAEEIVVMGGRLELPEDVARIRVDIPDAEKVLAIFTDVFDCFFRFLGGVLEEDGTLSGEDFWRTTAAVVRSYQGEHPELEEQFARHDLFAQDFPLSCLNRLQLRNNQQMLDLTDPSGGLQMAGRLQNPLARFA